MTHTENLETVLNEVESTIRKFVLMTEDECVTATLWIAATHAQPILDYATRLTIKSPHRRCGKSRLLEITEAMSWQSRTTVDISVAALVRTLDETDPPTLLIDEADKLFGGRGGESRDDLIGIINGGYQRNKPYVRWDVTSRSAESLPTFCMVAVAGIGDQPDTIEDRGPIITMRRRAPTERKPRSYRIRRDRPPMAELGERLHNLIRDRLDELQEILNGLTEHDERMPVEDRDADKWESLIAVADLAGGTWPERARASCKEMCAIGASDAEDMGATLLRDLHGLFEGYEVVPSSWLVGRLNALEESPWAQLGRNGLTANDLAALLKPYGVQPNTIRFTDGTKRGYYRRDPREGTQGIKSLQDAWDRYCRDCR